MTTEVKTPVEELTAALEQANTELDAVVEQLVALVPIEARSGIVSSLREALEAKRDELKVEITGFERAVRLWERWPDMKADLVDSGQRGQAILDEYVERLKAFASVAVEWYRFEARYTADLSVARGVFQELGAALPDVLQPSNKDATPIGKLTLARFESCVAALLEGRRGEKYLPRDPAAFGLDI